MPNGVCKFNADRTIDPKFCRRNSLHIEKYIRHKLHRLEKVVSCNEVRMYIIYGRSFHGRGGKFSPNFPLNNFIETSVCIIWHLWTPSSWFKCNFNWSNFREIPRTL